MAHCLYIRYPFVRFRKYNLATLNLATVLCALCINYSKIILMKTVLYNTEHGHIYIDKQHKGSRCFGAQKLINSHFLKFLQRIDYR